MPEVVVAPGLTLNGTDSRHYEDIAANQFRFLPLRVTAGDLERIHGVDERIGIDDYHRMIAVYASLVRGAG
jgi:carboxypeptidase PM20D1